MIQRRIALVRALVGFVMALRIGVASWWLVTHHTGGFLINGIVTIAIAVFVLWALYGNERSDEFFSS